MRLLGKVIPSPFLGNSRVAGCNSTGSIISGQSMD